MVLLLRPAALKVAALTVVVIKVNNKIKCRIKLNVKLAIAAERVKPSAGEKKRKHPIFSKDFDFWLERRCYVQFGKQKV